MPRGAVAIPVASASQVSLYFAVNYQNLQRKAGAVLTDASLGAQAQFGAHITLSAATTPWHWMDDLKELANERL